LLLEVWITLWLVEVLWFLVADEFAVLLLDRVMLRLPLPGSDWFAAVFNGATCSAPAEDWALSPGYQNSRHASEWSSHAHLPLQ